MLIRIISGVSGAVVVIGLMLFNRECPLILNFIVAIAGVMSIKEVLKAMGSLNDYIISIPSILFAVGAPFLGFGIYQNMLWYVYSFVIFGGLIFFKDKVKIKNVTTAYSLTLLIVMSLRFLVEIKDLGGRQFGGFYALTALGAAWYADTGAYFLGTFFGKHKLCEKISPKKTVEGVVGGLFFCVFLLNFMAFLFEQFVFQRHVIINYGLITFIAIIGSVISVLGDLSFSFVKRGYHIKDFGNAIPGHGGILDRIDSVIFVVPFVYMVMRMCPISW